MNGVRHCVELGCDSLNLLCRLRVEFDPGTIVACDVAADRLPNLVERFDDNLLRGAACEKTSCDPDEKGKGDHKVKERAHRRGKLLRILGV